jgi:hypothetical protein
MPVNEVFRGQALWQADVEVIDLTGHSKAGRAYAWSETSPDGKRFIDDLETSPIKSALDAVRASIVEDSKRQKMNELSPGLVRCLRYGQSFSVYSQKMLTAINSCRKLAIPVETL